MTVQNIVDSLQLTILSGQDQLDREIHSGFICDLLSWAMAHCKAGTAWVTVQTHLNVVAVASLLELACIIVPEGIEVEAASLQKAASESIVVLSSKQTAYALAGEMHKLGIPDVK